MFYSRARKAFNLVLRVWLTLSLLDAAEVALLKGWFDSRLVCRRDQWRAVVSALTGPALKGRVASLYRARRADCALFGAAEEWRFVRWYALVRDRGIETPEDAAVLWKDLHA